MRRQAWFAVILLAACDTEPDFVSITPQYGYADGCTPVTLQGSNLGEAAKAFVGGPNVDDAEIPVTPAETDDSLPDHAQDVGFVYYGSMPVSPRDGDGTGWQDITMEVDGISMTLTQAWYYLPCPGTFDIEDASYPEKGAAAGDEFTFRGCGLTKDVEMVVYDAKEAEVGRVALSGDAFCPTGMASAALPDLAAGDYTFKLMDPKGTVYESSDCVDITTPTKTKKGGTTKTVIGEACAGFPFTVGGA